MCNNSFQQMSNHINNPVYNHQQSYKQRAKQIDKTYNKEIYKNIYGSKRVHTGPYGWPKVKKKTRTKWNNSSVMATLF